jgi:anaerobic magnesium-protoporphyrin IX monomethyl ester cyclase
VPIVFGGIHAIAVPETVLKNTCVDYVIRGEGEHALCDLMDHLALKRLPEELKKINNLAFMVNGQMVLNPLRPYIGDLDALPFSDKKLFFDAEPVLRRNPYLLMSSRGCPYTCSYCCNGLVHGLYGSGNGSHVRRRSVENVLEELVRAKEQFAITSVGFLDDVFTMSRSWLEDFAPKYKARIGLPFHCNIHPIGFSAKIARLLKDNGCRLVFLDVQSGSERVRKEVFLRHESNECIFNAVRHLKDADLPFNADHIFGAPGETEEDLVKSFELYRAIRPNMLQSFWLTYYPGTRIVDLAKAGGFLVEKDIENINEGRTGFSHGIGSIKKDKLPLYETYELTFEALAVIRHDFLFKIISPLLRVLPFKRFFSMFLFVVTGLIYFPSWIGNKFRYLFFSRKKLIVGGA